MEHSIFDRFPDKETFGRYWEENYKEITYEDVEAAFKDYVNSVDKHIYLSDYEENGCISKNDFKENLSQEAQFMFQDSLTEIFYDKNPGLYEAAFEIYEEVQMGETAMENVAQIFHDTFQTLYDTFLDRLFDEIIERA